MKQQTSSVDVSGIDKYIMTLEERIRELRSPLAGPDLQYLHEAKAIKEFMLTSCMHDRNRRIQCLMEEISSGSHDDLLGGSCYLIIIVTSPQCPLLVEELGMIAPYIERLQESGPVTFDFGTRPGMAEEAELLIVKSQR